MSRHRAILVALATLFTAGTTSAALACCEWGNPAPLAYQWSGCGGCGPAMAPVTYAEPVFAGGCGGCGAPLATYAQPAVGWGGGCGCSGCGGCGGGYATPAIEPTPIAPSPIYVVNQGPDYTGPGIMVPYRVYGPGAGYAPPPAYSYVTGEPYPAGYGMNPYYAGPVRSSRTASGRTTITGTPGTPVRSGRIARTCGTRIAHSACVIDRSALAG